MEATSQIKLSNRSRFVIRVAAAITGDDPWKMGYREYHGTHKTLTAKIPRIRREHGGNLVVRWYHRGVPVAIEDIEYQLA